MEYGYWPKIIMAFDSEKLTNTWKEISSEINKQELRNLRKIYPTIEKSIDGQKIFLSRLSEDDPRRNTDYEIAYAKWVKGNPFDALRFVLIVLQNRAQLEILQ